MSADEVEELIQMLVRLVVDGILSVAEADAIVDFVREEGELPVGFQLPLPAEEMLPDNLDEIIAGYLSAPYRNFSIEVAQSEFEEVVAELTRQWLHAQITLRTWQQKFMDALIKFLAIASAAGADEDITGTAREDQVLSMIQVQLAYLSRFADSLAVNKVSEGQMEGRSRMYSGAGRASFFRENGRSNAQEGWVVDYVALDDRFTCEPCRQAEAEGPYLPDDPSAPLPGSVCLGRGYCRCVRYMRFDEAAWSRLAGEGQAA